VLRRLARHRDRNHENVLFHFVPVPGPTHSGAASWDEFALTARQDGFPMFTVCDQAAGDLAHLRNR
jgi:hypothetical protein